ncbi:MAG: MFS transporter [Eggerthella lenta]
MKRVKSERMGVYALFAIVVLASASGNLSQTAVNAMLGDIMLQFGLTVDLGQWLTTSYMLVLGITVPVATFLSRRFSVRQHVFIALAFFLVGALADLFAPNFGVLLAGRVFQAISTGMLMPLMQTIAMTRFPRGRQATAMGVAGIAMGFAPNIDPTIGGAMSFAGMAQLLRAARGHHVGACRCGGVAIKPSAAPDKSARLDVVSLAQSTLGFGGLLLAFSNASSFSFESPFIWAPLVLGALFLVLFVRRQKRVDDPLISMDIFSSRQYRAGFIAQNLLNASFMGVTLIVPLYVEGLCGGTALEAGVVLLPGTVAALVLNPLAGVLTDKVGVRPVALVSGAFLATGAVLMSFLDADTPLYVTTLCQAVRAVGVSGLVGPLTSWSLAQLPRPIVADGSSFCISARQACASLGTSVMVFLIAVAGASAAGLANPALAYQLAFGFSAVMAVATLGFIVAKVR